MASRKQEFVWIGTSDELRWVYEKFVELKEELQLTEDLKHLKTGLEECLNESFGSDEIHHCLTTIPTCHAVIFVLSRDLLYQQSEKKYLYNLVLTLANLGTKPRCGILLDMSREDLPLGLQNIPRVCLRTQVQKPEDLHNKLQSIKGLLKDSRNGMVEYGNIAQGQAFSNFFGYFNIILPDLEKMWRKFENEYGQTIGVNAKIFPKFVEIVLPRGTNRKLSELQIEDSTQLVPDEDVRKKVNEIFTCKRSRLGAKERSYPADLRKVCNRDGSKAFLFVGQLAPSGNVFGKLPASEDVERHRTCYAGTSQKISDHRMNDKCNNKLLVVQVKDVANTSEEVFCALEEHGNATRTVHRIPSAPSNPEKSRLTKCHIINKELSDQDDLLERIKRFLEGRNIEVITQEFGESFLNPPRDVDLRILILTEDISADDDLVAKCGSLISGHESLLIIKDSRSECEGGLEMCPFVKEYTKIEDGLSVTPNDLEQRLGGYLERGPKFLHDMMLISNVYIGLARAFDINYLKLHFETLKREIKKLPDGLPQLYEVIPLSGDCCPEKLKKIAKPVQNIEEKPRDFHPLCTAIYSKKFSSREVHMGLEYCAPIKTLCDMHDSGFGGLLTTDAKRREINFFIIELQQIINESDLKDFVTLVPLEENEDWNAVLTKRIKYDWEKHFNEEL